MQWWCSAQTAVWDWSWQAYPGVWAFVLLLAGGYAAVRRRYGRPAERWRTGSFFAGLAGLWIALDWPVGTLGAGYLASVHMVQYLLIALIAPPLLLNGLPRALFRSLSSRPAVTAVLRWATHPLVTLALFTGVLVYTHLPAVVDRMMATQLGSFALDMSWLAAGITFWWPVVCPVPARRWFDTTLAKIGYLIVATILNTAPFAFLAYSTFPLYATYELAPPVSGISARGDQQVAGFLMKIGGGVIIWTAISTLFYRWARRESPDAIGPETV